MGFDPSITLATSHVDAGSSIDLGGAAVEVGPADRARFADETNQLELRLAIIDARFDRLASRPDDAYRAFRRDTLARARDLAARAHLLETARQIGSGERRRVAALLVTLRSRVVALDQRHDELGDRRRRA